MINEFDSFNDLGEISANTDLINTTSLVQKQKTTEDDFFGLNFNQQNIDPFSKLETTPVKTQTPAMANNNHLFDFESVFKSPIPSSVTMPDLFNNNSFHQQNFSIKKKESNDTLKTNTALSPTKLTTTATPNSTTKKTDFQSNKPNLWDGLSSKIDISLDNLSPYSKGTKSNTNNIPMNNLMTNNNFQRNNFDAKK